MPIKKILIIISSLILVALCVYFFLFRSESNDTAQPSTSNGINLEPPTDEEKAVGDNQKDKLVEENRNQQNNSSSPSLKSVSVIITDAGQYYDIIEVRSFIPDHYQDGTCTIVFTKNGQRYSKDTPARTDSSSTICMNPLIKRSEFPAPGDWNVSVTYKSKGATGESETQTINIK